MVGKVSRFFREYILFLSIIAVIIGLFLLFMGIIWFWFKDMANNSMLNFIAQIQDWNAYVLVIGLIILSIGIFYLYSYLKDKKFALKELKTDKRSEFLKNHNELKTIIKRLPSKYHKMLKDKEDELRIK
jgi:magnesium-transporting ATPase (P-type)